MMTSDQFKQAFAPLVAALGGWLVGSGKLTPDQLNTYSDLLWKYGPFILTAAASAYAWLKNRPSEQVKTVAAMPDATKAAAVASLPEDQQARLATALPDKAVVAAAGAMLGVQVKVAPNAPAGALEAAADRSVPGVNAA